MRRQRFLLIAMGGMAILLLGQRAHAGSTVVSGHIGVGFSIGGRTYHPPVRERVIITRPWRHRFVRIGPPRPPVVIVRPPAIGRVLVEPEPVVVVKVPPVAVEEGTVTVWITNSNGSRTSVQLTRSGPWYIGPRGEYYTTMPTNEQLRVVYGF
jgi:hypothetical protein